MPMTIGVVREVASRFHDAELVDPAGRPVPTH
jgi:hypothetical protein